MNAVGSFTMYDQAGYMATPITVDDYAPLVKRIAQHMMLRMPASVQLEDLIQAGMIGLLEAAQKFDASQGASFETYAGIRIRGAIIDEMRKGDWVPRSVHRNSRKISEAIAEVEAREGRDASSAEVADVLGVSIDEYHAMCHDAACGRLFSIEESTSEEEILPSDDLPSGYTFPTPQQQMQKESLQQQLAKAINELPEREQMVLSLYYDDELNLKEIGQVLGVSESRVSQIHSQAALRLRSRLKGW